MELDSEAEIVCPNCNSKINADAQFCSNCGQRVNIPKITFREVFKDFFSTVFNLDGPFPRTIIKLFSAPKSVIDGYIGGKRKTYYHPIRYLVVNFFLSIIIGALVGFDPIENQQAISGVPDVDTASQQGYQVGSFISNHLNYFSLLLPLCIAVVSKFFFWNTTLSFAERLVLGFYLAGQYILIATLPIILTLVHPLFVYLMYPISLIYFTIVFSRIFVVESMVKTGIKSFFLIIFAMSIYFFLSGLIAYGIMIAFDLFV